MITTRKASNPRTGEQQAHRMGFGLIAKLSSDLKPAHEIGLRKESLRRKGGKRRPTTFSCFKHLNRNSYNASGIDYPNVIVSKGPLARPAITSVRLDADGLLTLTYSNRYYGGDPDDELFLVAYCPRLRSCLLSAPVPRAAETLTIQLPIGWLLTHSQTPELSNSQPPDIHLYAFFLGKKRFTSDSVYIPIPDIHPEHTTATTAPASPTSITPLDPITVPTDPINNPLNPFVDPVNAPTDPIKEPCDPIKTTPDPISNDPITARLYQLIRQDGTLTYADYAQRLGISEATVKRRLQTLKSLGLILRHGSNKAGHWELP